MKLSNFDYELPKELIAQYPLEERDSARLLVVSRGKGTIEHRIFRDVTDYLRKDDVVVLNNTKVLRSRLKGRRLTGGKVEALLLDRHDDLSFSALIRPGRVKIGEKIIFNEAGLYGIVSAKNEITFNAEEADRIYNSGVIPLPPYIKREPQEADNVYYQTVYAKESGSVASPTAGLHFTKELFTKMASAGIKIAYLTLHVGYATFKPVKAGDITEHRMEPEYFEIPEGSVRLVENARKNKGRVFAVGTTSMRSLETCCHGIRQGYTNLFIYPGYKFNSPSCLLTNFHLPRTTLFMLVCAFAGEGLIKKAYREAVGEKYRFYSYGDAMLII